MVKSSAGWGGEGGGVAEGHNRETEAESRW